MATLMGLRKRLTVPRIEVVSDKQDGVLVIEHNDTHSTITVRKPWESTWNASGPTFTIEKKDVPVLVAAIQGGDAEWTMRDRVIPTDTFTAEDVNEAAVAKEVEARCSQLDIERAKAANLAEEKANLITRMILDHYDDKHNPRLDGCKLCDEAIYPGHGDGSFLPYDPDDDSTKIPERGYGESMPSVDADDL